MIAERHTYIIEYKCYDTHGKVLQEGKMKAYRKLSKVQAQIDFEAFMRKKHQTFGRLEVIKCEYDNAFLEFCNAGLDELLKKDSK